MQEIKADFVHLDWDMEVVVRRINESLPKYDNPYFLYIQDHDFFTVKTVLVITEDEITPEEAGYLYYLYWESMMDEHEADFAAYELYTSLMQDVRRYLWPYPLRHSHDHD